MRKIVGMFDFIPLDFIFLKAASSTGYGETSAARLSLRPRSKNSSRRRICPKNTSRIGHQQRLQMPLAQTTATAESPINTTRKFWNVLPGDLAAMKNFPEFKRNTSCRATYEALSERTNQRRV
uniref:Uncharacterized protein n=1 Tax=Acrobeloides nanus TaxID=290746 RepID=A0A914CFX3_9BILA